MHLPINVKSPNNISKWQMGFNTAFKGLMSREDNIKTNFQEMEWAWTGLIWLRIRKDGGIL
jgi:hypothetical protein